MGGIAIGLLGVWILVQVLGGDALGRLGLTDSSTGSTGDGWQGSGMWLDADTGRMRRKRNGKIQERDPKTGAWSNIDGSTDL